MSRRRGYVPSETDLTLYPPRVLIDCPCGVRFSPHHKSLPDAEGEDDPKLCLTCNRAKWSRLWNNNRPIENKDEGEGEIVSMIERRPRR